MLRNRQFLRRWAAHVLVLWLFGIGIGVANACLTTAAAPKADRRGAQVEMLVVRSDSSSGHHGSLVTANCQDFCGKVAVSVPILKSALDDAPVMPAIPLLSSAAIAAMAPVSQPAQQWVLRRDGGPPSSIPIAYLRLAL